MNLKKLIVIGLFCAVGTVPAARAVNFTNWSDVRNDCIEALGTPSVSHAEYYAQPIVCVDASDYYSYSNYVYAEIPLCSSNKMSANGLCRTGNTMYCGKYTGFVMCAWDKTTVYAMDKCYPLSPNYAFVSPWYSLTPANHSMAKETEMLQDDPYVGSACGESGQPAMRIYSASYNYQYGCEAGYYQTGGSGANIICGPCPDDDGVPATSDEGNTPISGCYIPAGTYQASTGTVEYKQQCNHD